MPASAHAATLYVAPAPAGSDSNAGTSEALPLASMGKAQELAKPGDTVLLRAGTYAYSQGTTTCKSGTDTISGVVLDKDGSAGSPINYFAYPGEVPVFDFDGIRDSCRIKGILVSGDYIHLRGLEIKGVRQNNDLNHESWGVWVQGSHNTFELLNLHHNMGPGLFIQHGSDNLVLNCDSHHNFDEHTSNGAGESADGFGCHVDAGETGNVIRGCRAWWNTDDGYDFINARAACTVEYSWAWFNGYKPDTMDSIGNGNGFKGGGYGTDPSTFPATPPQHVVRFCLAFANKAAGFYANHSPISELFYNNTSYGNHPDFNMLGMNAAGADTTVGVYRNNIALGGTLFSNRNAADDANNSWSIGGLTVTDVDFQSVATTGVDARRGADGSLPVLPNFHLAAGSDLIDAGTDLKFPFTGKAPDLGAFEVGAAPPGGLAGAGGGSGAASGGSAATQGGAASGGTAQGGSVNGVGGSFGNDGGSFVTAGAATDPGGTASAGAANVGTGGGAGPMTPAPAGSSGDVSPEDQNNGCGCRFTKPAGPSSIALLLSSLAFAWLLRRRHEARVVANRSRT